MSEQVKVQEVDGYWNEETLKQRETGQFNSLPKTVTLYITKFNLTVSNPKFHPQITNFQWDPYHSTSSK